MSNLSPSQIAQKWKANTTSTQAIESYKQGVNAVQVSPMELAIQNAQKAKDNFVAAIDSGRWANGLRRVKLADWQRMCTDKGAQRISAGVTAAMPKMEAFMGVWQPQMQAAKRELKNMPNNSRAEALEKVGYIYDIGKRFAGKA